MSLVRRRFCLVLLAGVLAAPFGAAAEEPAKGWSYDLATTLMSPYCPGRTLMDCTSSQAAELRDWITAQEKAGVSRESVERTLYLEYGDVILQAPKASGFGLAAYVIPAVGLVAGGAIVALFLRRQAKAAPAMVRVATPVDAELDRRIDEEMQRSG
jgi:cytochrome c-type biogenesis protein CcmH/NrfF